METQSQKLYRNTQEGVVAGVCAGLAEYFKVDAVWIRLAFVVTIFLGLSRVGFLGPITYIILWIILPTKPVFLFPNEKNDSPPVNYYAGVSESEQASTIKPKIQQGSRKPVLGVILLGVGVLLLLVQLDYLDFRDLSRYWPLILIVLGISIIISSVRRRKDGQAISDPELRENEHEN